MQVANLLSVQGQVAILVVLGMFHRLTGLLIICLALDVALDKVVRIFKGATAVINDCNHTYRF